MTTSIIGTGGLGSVIARQLASGGETLRLSSADNESARTLAAQIGRAAVVAVARPLHDQVMLKLGDRADHMEHQPPGRGSRVESLV